MPLFSDYFFIMDKTKSFGAQPTNRPATDLCVSFATTFERGVLSDIPSMLDGQNRCASLKSRDFERSRQCCSNKSPPTILYGYAVELLL